jgi:hypothetical protein
MFSNVNPTEKEVSDLGLYYGNFPEFLSMDLKIIVVRALDRKVRKTAKGIERKNERIE